MYCDDKMQSICCSKCWNVLCLSSCMRQKVMDALKSEKVNSDQGYDDPDHLLSVNGLSQHEI